GEISAAESGIRNCGCIEVRRGLAQALVIEEEKCPVLPIVEFRDAHGAAEFSTKQVVSVLRAGLAQHIVEEVVCVQRFIPEVLVYAAMILVSHRIRNERHGAA